MQSIDDYACCRSTILESLTKKFGKQIKISSIKDVRDGLKRFTFNIGQKDIEGNVNELHITTTEEDLIFKLFEISVQRKNVCLYCENNGKENCLEKLLQAGQISKDDICHKMDKELVCI